MCVSYNFTAHTHSQIIGISVAATVFVIITAVAYLIFIIRGQRRKKGEIKFRLGF